MDKRMVQKTDVIALAKPYITEEAIQKAVEVLNSGNLVQGKFAKELEADLCQYLQIKHCILVSSGTAALFCCLKILDIGAGDEVIIPALTFMATANVVEAVGATPVIVDIDSASFNIDVEKITAAITSKTKAIIPVHEFGQSTEMNVINNIAEKYGITIIEDAACALGTIYKDKKVGNFGTISCFSFHPRKIITTGEGGMVVTNNDTLAEKIRAFINHGITYHKGYSDVPSWGLNFRITDFQAAIGIPQLKILDSYLANRIKLAGLYNEQLRQVAGLTVPAYITDISHTYQTYHLLLDSSFNRDIIIQKLKDQGIQTNLGAQAIHMLSYYRNKYGYSGKDFPHAQRAYTSGLALPIGHHISKENIDYICSVLIDVFNKYDES